MFGQYEKTLKNCSKGLNQIEKLKTNPIYKYSNLLLEFEAILKTLAFQAEILSFNKRKSASDNIKSIVNLHKQNNIKFMAPTVATLLSLYAAGVGDSSSCGKQITRVLLMEEKEKAGKDHQASDGVDPQDANKPAIETSKIISNELAIFAWMSYVLTQLQDWSNIENDIKNYVKEVLNERIQIEKFSFVSSNKNLLLCAYYIHALYDYTTGNLDKSLQNLQAMMTTIENTNQTNASSFQKNQAICLILAALVNMKKLYIAGEDKLKRMGIHGHGEEIKSLDVDLKVNDDLTESVSQIAVNLMHSIVLSKKGADKRLTLFV